MSGYGGQGGGSGGSGGQGGQGGGEGQGGGSSSAPVAPVPASAPPSPAAPLISPTGNIAVDSLSHIVNKAAEPWQDLPNKTPVEQVATVVNGVLSVLNMDVAVDAFNMGVGALSSLIPFPALPAATLTALHIGSLHTHTHPPSLVPPAPPIPLPSIGPVMIGGCVSVLIGGLPAARAGDLGISVTCGTLAPPFAVATGSSSVFIGGSRAARMGDITKHCGAVTPSEFSKIGTGFAAAVGLLNAAAAPNGMAMAMAAAQTAADAAKAAMAALMGTDPGIPPCIGMVMLGNPTVLIGGLPIPPIEDFARAFFQKLLKPLANALHGVIKKNLGEGRAANFFHELVCHTTGHPVDVASGRMLTSAVDLALPGPLPLKFKRQYATSWSNRDGVLGWGWSHSYDEAVWLEPDAERGGTKTVYRAEDGREIEFDTSNTGPRPAWVHLNEFWDPFNRLTLRVMGKAHWEIEGVDGQTREFRAPLGGRRVTGSGSIVPGAPLPAGRRELARLMRVRDRAGNTITLSYDSAGNLETIVDSGGREIRLESDRAGRLARIMVPHPTTSGFVEHVRYAYSAAGDLVDVYDAAGKPFSMAYEGHLLIRETNRNGLSFFFQYEGGGPAARCVKTWGDGDIYTRTLTYDLVNHLTFVGDSYGYKTTYQMNEDNAVLAVTDALGGVTKYGFDSAYHKLSETDAVGGETKWEYDARGNCTKLTMPDGAEVALEYNDRNQPVVVVDPTKGKWQWGYDGRGLLVVRVDPLDRRARFVWQSDPKAAIAADAAAARRLDAPPPPKRLVSMVDPADQATTLTYDPAGNLVSLRVPSGATSRWKYDNLGRCLVAVDPSGNQQLREFDEHGWLRRVREPDGNTRDVTFDAEGNVLSARDRRQDIKFTYQGMGRLRSRTEAGTTIEFEYDREERLIGIKNEHGHAYRFTRGPTGQLTTEAAFDGVVRTFERDLVGRVTKVLRPDKSSSNYSYDAGGRISTAKYSDGTSEAYAYREDGALIQAKNDAGLVSFERDQVGRVVREMVGDDWVESTYDLLGKRVGIRSSRGLEQRIERNNAGDVLGIRARVSRRQDAGVEHEARPEGAGEVTWAARFQRDSVGLEMERTLPGGISARWERDNLGRPKSHTIWSGDVSTSGWHYTWDFNNRLSQVVDLLKGPTQYQHDALGNLAAATYDDGRVDLRMPDAVGNLFRTADRSDRTYGPAGELLEARDATGGVTRYQYDVEGNLIQKVELDAGAVAEPAGGRVWTYSWNGSGMLKRVVRPDGDTVEFAYDALGRRLWKKFRGATTRWVWDGNVPLHEWVEREAAFVDEPAAPVDLDLAADEAAARRRRAERAARPAQAPPGYAAPPPLAPAPSVVPTPSRAVDERGTADAPITWLFDPETFAPLAKLVGESRYSIITDHRGTPQTMYDANGAEAWAADTDAYGDLRAVRGNRQACPFRLPGQYEDAETGLYYNRYRYYDPSAGSYTSRDRLKYHASLRLYGYVADPLGSVDPLGLAACVVNDTRVGYEANLEMHRELFRKEGGGSFVMTQKQYERFAAGQPLTGDPSGQFIATKDRMDALFRDSRGDLGHIEKSLGFDPGHFADGDGLVRIDVPESAFQNFRTPSGLERGANDNFRYGGYTSGGQPEAVIDPTPTALTTKSTLL